MNFGNLFKNFYLEKKNLTANKVDSTSKYYKIIMKDMKQDLRTFLANDDIFVKPSVGQGNYSDIPWICLLSANTSISPNAQKGIYIVILFNKTCNSLFLCLSQGITNFNQMHLKPKQKLDTILRTVTYFQKNLPEEIYTKYDFTKSSIYLGDNISNLAKGYILTTIISKMYTLSDFDQNDFYKSLVYLVKEYGDIVDTIGIKSYDDVIGILNPGKNIDSVTDAIEKIQKTLKEEFTNIRDSIQKPIRVNKGELRTKKYLQISQEKVYKKVDYLKKAKEQFQTGLKGELIALSLERNRVDEMGLDPDDYVKHVSTEADSYGYDIESVDIFNGEKIKIFIEVKSTKDIKDTSFFVSKNEVETSKIKKNTYRIFRIFDISSTNPKYYYADGEIEQNFYLDPVSYSARYKYDVA